MMTVGGGRRWKKEEEEEEEEEIILAGDGPILEGGHTAAIARMEMHERCLHCQREPTVPSLYVQALILIQLEMKVSPRCRQ